MVVSENVFCQVPVVSRIWCIARTPQQLHLRHDAFRLPVLPITWPISTMW